MFSYNVKRQSGDCVVFRTIIFLLMTITNTPLESAVLTYNIWNMHLLVVNNNATGNVSIH